MIRVLIADDQPLMRQGFAMILGAQPDITEVGEAGTGTSAVAQARELNPDVIMMDIQMPGMDGITATRQLRGCKILVLTTFGTDEHVAQALRAEASGFLLKDATPEQLIHAVLSRRSGAARPRHYPQPHQASAARAHHPRSAAPIRGPWRPGDQVLRLIAQGMTNAEIAALLVVSEATVKTRVSRLLTKLDLRDRVQPVVAAYQHGLV